MEWLIFLSGQDSIIFTEVPKWLCPNISFMSQYQTFIELVAQVQNDDFRQFDYENGQLNSQNKKLMYFPKIKQ